MTVRHPFAAWCPVLIFLAFVPATGAWVSASGHDFARVLEVGLCLLCSAVWAVTRDTHIQRRKLFVVISLVVLSIGSTTGAANHEMAARELSLLLGLACVAAVVATCWRSTGAAPLLATVSVGGAFYSFLTFIGLGAELSVADTLHPFNLITGYDNGRFFNHVQTSMLPLLALATMHPFQNRILNRLAAFALAMGIALLVLSEGRATGLALVIGAVVGTALFPRTAWPVLRSVAIACTCAAAIYLALYVALPRIVGVQVEPLHVDGVADTGSAHARFILWRIALEGIRRSPWLGIGPMHFSHTWNIDAAHPHNVYLQVAEEWGVPMLVLLLGIALFGIRALYRAVRDHRGDEADRRIGLVLFATVIAIGIDGMLSGNFVMPVSQVWIAVVGGAAIGWVRRAAPQRSTLPANPPSPAAKAGAWALRFLPLLSMLWLSASVAPELGTRFLDRPGPTGIASDAGAPRFWSNGWF